MAKFEHPVDQSQYVTYEYGKDGNDKARTVQLYAPDVAAMSEGDFVKQYLGANGEDESKDEPVLFEGLKRSGRETHLKAAYAAAKAHVQPAATTPPPPVQDKGQKKPTE